MKLNKEYKGIPSNVLFVTRTKEKNYCMLHKSGLQAFLPSEPCGRGKVADAVRAKDMIVFFLKNLRAMPAENGFT